MGRFILDNYCRGASKSAGERAREHRRRIYTEEKAKVVAAFWGYRMFSYVVGEKPNVALVVLALFSAIF